MKNRVLSKIVPLALLSALAMAPAVLPANGLRAQETDTRSLVEKETERINDSMERAREVQTLARAQAARGDKSGAIASYEYALSLLDPNPLTQRLINQLQSEKASLERTPSTAGSPDPAFQAQLELITKLLDRGRAQFLAGDLSGAETTFKDVETRDPTNAEAKNFLRRIAEARRASGWLDREKTREQMLEEVSRGWQRPGVFMERQSTVEAPQGPTPLIEKLEKIVIPSVDFSGIELARVVSTLSAASEEFDNTGITPAGVNIVLIDPNRLNPEVNIALRNLSLKRVLDFICDSVGFQYEVQSDAVVVRPGGEVTNLETEFFPISRATVIRMVAAVGGTPAASDNNDPFAAPEPGASAAAGESDAIRQFLQQAGVNFEGTPGASLVYDGSAMIVTHTSRNLTRVRNILNRYSEVRQVEIEAKFLDVAEGVLEELGIDWSIEGSGEKWLSQYRTTNRSLDTAFSPSATSSKLTITRPGDSGLDLPVVPPNLPGGIDLGTGAAPIASLFRTVGDFNVNAIINALSRNSGSDLLSAPKVTVLSGNRANITVAQEFRYPQSYGDIESQVGQTGGTINGGSAGVTITAGTPQDFATRNIGVELDVTPTVEEDDYSISLDLHPRVTEFDGFVEYGGSSVAISGDTTVTVPSGFFQPIFSVREMRTKVTIWDGATVVMGGLTREEIKRVKDKVPVLGDIPLVGRLFRNEGETEQKRNLLIFVTANLVSPGGSLKKQSVRGVSPNSLFQNPTIVTPGGSVDRSPQH